MKKILAVALTLMLIPFSAFGLEMLEDSTLDSVTGQAGVSINVDVQVDATIGTAAWGDDDGISGTSGEGGYVGLQNMVIDTLRARARDDWALSGDATLIAQLEFLTIDVATDATYNDGTVDRTYVRINPGTFDITMASFTADVALGADTTMGQFMGEVFMTDMLVRLDAGNYIDIYTHGDSGVSITMSVNMDTVSFATIGWGDTDGLVGYVDYGVPSGTLPYYVISADDTTAGYVGLAGLEMTELTVSGTVTFDVLTNLADMDALDVANLYAIWLAYNPSGVSSSFVHIGLDAVTITLDEMVGEVQVGSSAALGEGTLGDFYVADVVATVNGWVDIFAH
ncbi:DUF6160 family protein [uncultured Desulfosarcina sp.]|uniref:DUF6160 family protein n=1 Tax=uncultured Desulfosarcina sp. TaxID=218289 RepID=UPI0029C624DE|nr:DUF6160 family protein [uncultured Desulfosarcina sp.]